MNITLAPQTRLKEILFNVTCRKWKRNIVFLIALGILRNPLPREIPGEIFANTAS